MMEHNLFLRNASALLQRLFFWTRIKRNKSIQNEFIRRDGSATPPENGGKHRQREREREREREKERER